MRASYYLAGTGAIVRASLISRVRMAPPIDLSYRTSCCIERAHAQNALIDVSFGCPGRYRR
jgi:hypothetical protein